MQKTILIVDDKLSMQRMVADYLTQQSFRCVTANNGREALFTARHEKPDLILLDIMMPEMDGYEFIRQHRKERETPIILLTARLDEADKVIGLELGADDYITKPFGMAELVARIRAVLRRTEKQAVAPDVIRIGNITLDRSSHSVMQGSNPIDLTPSEFAILSLMMQAHGQVFSRLDLLEHLKGDSLDGVERTIDVHIRNLRAKIETDARNPDYILTVFGVGYRFNSNF